MGHPSVVNRTPFVLETLFVADENGVPLCVPIVKATFTIGVGGVLSLAEEQLPVLPAGTFRGDPGSSSCIYEPETAFFKPSTDVVLIGHAHPDSAGASEVTTGIRVGAVQKIVRVVGDRFMTRRSGTVGLTSTHPLERIPLTYERAFGGWDRRHPDSALQKVEARNPVGIGFRDPAIPGDDDVRLPNLEDPNQPFQSYGDCPPPAAFGFVSPNWMPRSQLAGTYGERWAADRSPLLPEDFDRRFFNAASPGLVAPGYLRGDEEVVVLNASPEQRLAFELPAVAPPACQVELRGGRKATLETNLDTVIVDTDARRLVLIWRTHLPLRTGPHDLIALHVRIESGTVVPA